MNDHDDQAGAAAGTAEPASQRVLSPAVHSALASLGDLDDAPLTEHIERYQQIHTGLQDALTGIEGV